MNKIKRIPVFDSLYEANEEKYIIDVIRSGRISSQGEYVLKFEDSFAGYLGSSNGITVANGTAALETAYYAINLSKGDEIIMPSFTIISCAIGAIRLGAIPVFVDVEDKNWGINPNLIEAEITSKTKAILAVHMYGHPCNMDPIMRIAKKYGLIVIEDASQVHGADYKGTKCGNIGHISTFSFYANKIISTGEGGMVVTSNNDFAIRARDYRNLCFLPEKRFYHTELGNNYRMGALQAAVGLAQLENIEEVLKIKIKNGKVYRDYLKKIPGVQIQEESPNCTMVYWMYCAVIVKETEKSREQITKMLRTKYKIDTRPFFIGLHEQPVIINYLSSQGIKMNSKKLPITEFISKLGLYFPSGLNLSSSEIEYVCDSFKSLLS